MKNSLLMVNTGNGKGKTTAALGMAMRAVGHGQRVCMIQFIKGKWQYGELESARMLGERFELKVMGRGFTWKSENLEADTALAREAWETAKEKIASGRYDLVILDELTYLMLYGMVNETEVLEALRNRPLHVHVLITGRKAPQGLVDAADMVTDMTPVKHHYESGIKAQKGIEY